MCKNESVKIGYNIIGDFMREFLINEAESVLHTEIDRYVILTETAYKSIFNVFCIIKRVFLNTKRHACGKNLLPQVCPVYY